MNVSNKGAFNYRNHVRTNRDRTALDDKVRVVFYARVSTQHEAQCNALENQMEWCMDLLDKHPNWEMVKPIYVDRGLSGTVTDKRPGFMSMMQDASNHEFDMLVVREVCRLNRNTVDSLMTTRELADIGIEVFFYNDNIYSLDSDGELRLTIMSAMAQEESRKVSERSRAGQYTSRQNGVLYGNGNILGYKLEKNGKSTQNTYSIDPEQGPTVARIFELYLQGKGLKAITTILTQENRKNACGVVKWDGTRVRRVLRNETYTGKVVYGKSYVKNYLTHQRVNVKDSNLYTFGPDNKFPALVSQEDFDKVQKMLDNAVKTLPDGRRVNNTGSKDIIKKKLVCSCGSHFALFRWKGRANETSIGYSCKNFNNNHSKDYRKQYVDKADWENSCNVHGFPRWRVEMLFWFIVKRVFRNQERTVQRIASLVEKNYVYDAEALPYQRTASMVSKELERAKQRVDNLLQMRLDGTLDAVQYITYKKDLDTKVTELEQELECLLSEEPVVPESYEQEKVARVQKARDVLKELTDVENTDQMELLDKLVIKIVPCPNETFKFYLKLRNEEVADDAYILYDSFSVSFDEAKAYRKAMGHYLRANQYKELLVEVYV